MNAINKIKIYLNLLRYKGLREKIKYSKNGEDLFLSNYFKDISDGRYIDVGAFHPFRNSNTYFLYKKGWSGINIDFNKTSIDLFNIARPKDVNIKSAISDGKKKIKIYQNKDLGIMNTANIEYASIFLKKNFNSKDVWSDSLNNVLEKHDDKNLQYELLDLDAEGSDYLILKSINFEKYIFKLILVETHRFNSYTKEETNKIHIFLKSKSYKYIKSIGETSVFENLYWKK